MAIDYARLKAWPFGEIAQRYTHKDVILYALGLSLGSDPTDAQQLRYVYEDGLRVLPGFALLMGYPGFWIRDAATGVDWKKVLNVEQGVEIFRPLPAEASLIAHNRVEEIVDRGPGKDAIVYVRREILDATTRERIAAVTHVILCRGHGGFGGPVTQARPPAPAVPETAPSLAFDWKTLSQSALIFRLSGDDNPLHADPAIAKGAGFDRPILHGAALFGIASHALVQLLCGGEPERLRAMNVRFSSPVYPGETVRTEVWPAGNGRAAFRARVAERGAVVLDRGTAIYDDTGA